MTHDEIMSAIDALLDRQFELADRLGMTREWLIAVAKIRLEDFDA